MAGGRSRGARPRGNPQLAALLAEARLSAAELARRVNALAAAQQITLTYDRTSVAHWLKGSKPRQPVPDLVALALGRHIGRPVTAEETGLAPPSAAARPRAGGQQSPEDRARGLASLCRADIDPSHRAALVREIYVPLADLPVWRPPSASAEPPLPPLPSAPQLAAVDGPRLSHLTNVFADLWDRYGGGHARSALAAYMADDVCRLLALPGSSRPRDCQFSGAAQLVHVLARMTADAGHAQLAQHYYAGALALAETAGDRKVYAITLRAMSVQAVRLGFLAQGWETADRAVHVADSRCGPAAQAFVLSQRAVVHARLHREKEALADLAQAEAEHSHATSTPAGPFTSYPRSGLEFQRAEVFDALGSAEDAIRALASAARRRSDAQRRPKALTQARLAALLLRAGRLDAACAQWHAFLSSYPHLRSAEADAALRDLREGLRPYQRHESAAGVLRHARACTPPRRDPVGPGGSTPPP
ncbi:hypothetical protein ACIQ1J_06565 [Streptomyces sp. NPDC097107]|uniref:hypothetical protein n=1 Tax=Streptomyces sp. NPDC097107 TaxID=3366089 RepID=UPI00380BA9FB